MAMEAMHDVLLMRTIRRGGGVRRGSRRRVMVGGDDNDDDGGDGVGAELVGMGDVEFPTGSAKLSGPWLARRRLGPRWAFCCGAIAAVVTVVVLAVGATGVIRCVAPWRCRWRTVVSRLGAALFCLGARARTRRPRE